MVRQAAAPGQRPERESRPAVRRPRATFACLLLAIAAQDCGAVNQVVLKVRQVSTASVQVSEATMTLNVQRTPDSRPPTLRAQIDQVRLPSLGATYRNIDVLCTDLLVRKPRFECNQGTIAARGGPTGQIAMSAAGTYDSSTGAATFKGSGLRIAGGTARFAAALQGPDWSANLQTQGLDLAEVRKLANPWFAFPKDHTLTGHLEASVRASGKLDPARGIGKATARLSASTADLNYSNPPGTLVAQNLTTSISGNFMRSRDRIRGDVDLQTSNGQALAGSVLLDFGRNPLTGHSHVELTGPELGLSQSHFDAKDLIDAQGNVEIAFAGPVRIKQAHFDVARLDAAAAYRTFLQLTLATTDFGALKVGGRASGEIGIADDAINRINVRLQNLSMADSTTRLSLANANGEIHWTSVPGEQAEQSRLSWSSSSAYGLIGGPVQMSFTAHERDFSIAADTRFPVFDGALVIHTLAIRRLGAPDTEVDFDAHLEPISMPLLSKAFGWPILSGQLAGRIPGVTYRDRVLAVDGDLSANVFDGTIIGSRIKLSDPWGPWPRLNADVVARRLDLDLLTHTFSIGSISGRLDADIKGLELFNWSPIAFDARLQTTPGDRSAHLISARAVTSISNVGGGGGSVATALQSGFLKFFHEFRYDRLGIRCQLRDEVCLMSGVEPAKTGYYLVKGRGLPRIDIIGNAGRVDWPQLVGQIAASIHSQNIIVR